MLRVILGPVGIVVIAGLIGIAPSLLLVLYGVDEPRIVGPLLLVPVIAAAVATWFRERIERNRDRVGWLYCGWILGDRRAVGAEDLAASARARGLVVVIPECKEEWGYLFVVFAAEYLDRFTNLSVGGSTFINAMEQRDERIESEGVEYAVFLSHGSQRVPILEGEEVIVSLSRYPSRQ